MSISGWIFNRQKRRRILFALILIFIGLEVGLRLMGVGYHIAYRPSGTPDPDKFTIFCMGESTTLGAFVDEKDNYPAQLHSLLQQRYPQMKIQVLFDGRMGANSSRMLLQVPEFFEKYKPDLVIAMIGANNHLDLDKSNALLFSRNELVSRVYWTLRVFAHKSRLVRLARHLYLKATHYQGVSDNIYDLNDIPEHHKKLFDDILRYDLGELVRTCRENNIGIAFSGYPLATHRDIYLETSKKLSVPFADNWPDFEKLQKEGRLQDYLIDDNWHPNAAGYRIIAENVLRSLLENHLLPDLPSSQPK